ncbi:MAG: GNAT family N-acetyltransferase [Pseudomonadota bacterium]
MIRQATQADAPACAAILDAWIDATPWMPRIHPSDDVVRYFRKTVLPERRVWVVGQPLSGFLALDEDAGDITALYLAETARGQGFGRRLLGAAKTVATQLTLWTFVANTGAQRFYAANGFKQIDRTDGDNEEGFPDLRYRWTAT